MPPRKLTAGEQALVNKWVPWTFYFLKMMRRANRYLGPIPNEIYMAAYKEVCNSGLVAGGEWSKQRDPNDKSYWEPHPEDREACVKYMKDLIERHPITSPYNAVMVFFAGNGGSMCVNRIVAAYESRRAQREYLIQVHKLNNADLKEVNEKEKDHLMKCNNNNPGPVNNDIPLRDPNERPIDRPFVRARPRPSNTKVSTNNWHQYEKIGQTYFVKDSDDDTGYNAFELAGILILKNGKFYQILYEGNVDSIQITERELFAMVEDGIWV